MVPTIRICTSLEFSTDFTSTTGGSWVDFRAWFTTSWEPQEEGVMSTIVSFPSVMKPKFNRQVWERNHFWRLMLTGFWQGTLPAPATMWNLHTTQPRYFDPTCSEVVNLTGLLKTKD
jgi:hypothetical protein